MDELFTNAEKHRLDQLYGYDMDVDDFTLEDVKLIQRWEQVRAQHDEKTQAKIELMQQESEQRMEQNQTLFESARKVQKEFAARARKRYKELRNGQEK